MKQNISDTRADFVSENESAVALIGDWLMLMIEHSVGRVSSAPDRVEHVAHHALREPALLVVVDLDHLVPVGGHLGQTERLANVDEVENVLACGVKRYRARRE